MLAPSGCRQLLLCRSTCALSLVFLFCACANVQFGKRHAPNAKPLVATTPSPVEVGEVATVNQADRFVLIDVGSRMVGLPVGQEVQTARESGEGAKLKITTERNSPFVSADIVSGEPRSGDKVYR